MGDLYENLNEKNINYGALNRFYQDLKSHDLADLNDKIDNFDLSAVYNLIYALHPNEDYLNFSANLPNTKVRLVLFSRYAAEPSTPIDIDYSFDRINWTHYTVGNDITIPTDGKVYLRGNNDYFCVYDYNNYGDTLYFHYFNFENNSQNTLNVEAHGNINSLLSKTNWNEITALPEYCYYQMFQGCTSLTTAPTLPATTLANSCYRNIFKGCTSLTTVPELPATRLADYCYANMFQDCVSLTTAPELPITTLANNCYTQMFQRCTSLTTAPTLPATTLANSCYQLMFYGCTSLNYIKCLATDVSARNCTANWVGSVASTGTFVKAANMTGWTTGVNGIPSGWTVEDYTETVVTYTEPVVTEPIIVDETTFTGVTLTVDGSQPSIVASGSTTIEWRDLASSIPSGKTVEVSVVVVNTGNSALTPTMSGNYKMMGAGNITIQPLELGLYKAKYISEVNVWLIEATEQQ